MKDWKKAIINENSSIRDLLNNLDQCALQISLIVDNDHKLKGAATDGDVRRGLLEGFGLEDSVSKIMNPNPFVVSPQIEKAEIIKLMKNNKLHQIPSVDSEGRVVHLFTLDELLGEDKEELKENPVVLMVGGLGSRLKDLTKDCPKPLLKVGDRPILELIIENFIKSGFYKFHLCVNYKSEMIQDYFGDGSKWGVEIKYHVESKRLGTAGALSLVKDDLALPFIVMNGDLLTKADFSRLLEFHQKEKCMATMCARKFDYQVPYGVIRSVDGNITSIDEKPKESFFVNAGIYVLTPDVLSMIPENEMFDMTTLFEKLIDKDVVKVFPLHEYWTDIGHLEDYTKANNDYKNIF